MAELRLKELRKEKNLSQEDVAKKIGVNHRTISNYETGYSEPDIKTIEKLCKMFDVTAGYLLGIEN